jgi:uncharacterized protein (DUF2336 family)
MIVRQFIHWVRTAPANERAEATRSMARAWLLSDLSEDDAVAAEGALLMMLDDPSPLVRLAMAETFAKSVDAPVAIVQALSQDHPLIALPILEYSPLLLDADLVDLVATGPCELQCAVARRIGLPASISAAIAEVGTAPAVLELIRNPYASILPFSWDRIVERHGHIAEIREAILVLEGLPAATRLVLMQKLSTMLATYVVQKNWLPADRAERIASDVLDRTTIQVAAESRGDDTKGLVRHLRATGQLTSTLLLRSLLSGNLELFEFALVELTGLSSQRVAAIIHDAGGSSLHALLTRAGFPNSAVPAMTAALMAHQEMGFVGSLGGESRLRRRVVERVLTLCETDETCSEQLLVLLRRFATEAAREEARLFCDELAGDSATPPLLQDRLAA